MLSGYLITMLLTRELEKTSTIGLTRFYVRRAYRILPGAMLFMAAVFVIFWHELRWYQVAAVVLDLLNYDFAHPWFIGHLWSLSVQEQFYFGVLRLHTTALLLFVLWPVMHFSIAGLLLHVMQRPCRILNFGPG